MLINRVSFRMYGRLIFLAFWTTLSVVIISGVMWLKAGIKFSNLGVVWKFTGIEINGTNREKTTDATRKNLLKTKAFPFLTGTNKAQIIKEGSNLIW